MNLKNFILTILFFGISFMAFTQNTNYDIRLNQIGFLPNSKKVAAIVNSQADSFKVATSNLSSIVFEGELLPASYYASSDENISIADFTLMTTPGDYVILVADKGKSVPFSVRDDIFTNLSKASLKYFYFNRASTPILNEYAGVYAREAGHPDTAVVVLPSAASPNRPAGTILSTPGGWYDAGDYNKYVVNSGISTFTLLSAYESYPEYYDSLDLNIPESANLIPDILDEALWNIKWMMTMQDTNDGGVYNKTTEASFSSWSMPDQVNSTRYVCAKGTAATLDFAAIMSMTARIYKKYDPILAEQALNQAIKAWNWAKENPDVEFNNPSASGGYPGVSTGGYGDNNFADEFSWCAAELYITTKNNIYYNEINLDQAYDMPGWPIVQTLGLLSLLNNKDSLTAIADTQLAINKLIDLTENHEGSIITSPYRIPGDFFYWGGNNAYANWGMLFMQAYRQTQNASFFNAAVSSLDYLLGKNAISYSFVTGMGTKYPMKPHHRISIADGVLEPVPGMLVGGPNLSDHSDCGEAAYLSSLPAKSYLDEECSYSTNEVAINWNAPLAFLIGAIQGEYLNTFKDSMPAYLSISARNISLPANSGFEYSLVLEGNTGWTLLPSEEWIEVSADSGLGSAIVMVSSLSDNNSESDRFGKILIQNLGQIVDSINITQTGKKKNFRLEAEDYVDMLGLQTESTSDVGNGLNLGFVDAGDWASYNIDISFTGSYDVTFRHAGWAGDIDVIVNDTLLKNVTYNETADWQIWESYTTQLNFYEGEHIFKLKFNSPGTNLNWIEFNWIGDITPVQQQFSDHTIRIFPIPTGDYLQIELDTKLEAVDIQLYSFDGKVILHKTCHDITNELIDVQNINNGMYLLKIITDSGIYTKIIIIER